MSLKAAINGLADVDVAGVVRSYSVDEIKAGVASPELPALLPLPFRGLTDQPEFATFGVNSTNYFERHTIRHRLLIVPIQQAASQGEALYSTVILVDDYLEAIQAVDGATGAKRYLCERYEAGVVEWNGVSYYGVDFFTDLWVND